MDSLTYKRNTDIMPDMGILTVRLSDEEERMLERRSREAGMKKATFVRKLIRDQPFETAGDVLAWAQANMGDARLRIRRPRP